MPLFEPTWKSNKPENLTAALQALEGISDQKRLRDVALGAGLSEVRVAAIEKITDQKLLREIVLAEDSAFDAKKAAVQRISDEQVLAEIAVLRKCYPADGEAIARMTDIDLLKMVAMAEEGWEQSKAVYRISDQNVLAEIAVHAEKAAARKTAIRTITNMDILLDLMETSEERFVKNEAFRCFDELLRNVSKLSQEQHERYLNVILQVVHLDDPVSLDFFKDRADLERIYRHAQREDLRVEAFSRLIAGKMNSPQRLHELWKLAGRNYVKVQNRKENPWAPVLNSVNLRILNSHDPSLLVQCIGEAECGCDLAADFVKELFGARFQDEAGIDLIRDEGVAAYISNLEAYEKMDPEHDMVYCLLRLAEAVPPEASANKWYNRFLKRVR